LVSGLILLYLAVQDWTLFAVFLGLGLAAIWAAISYTSGSNPYGYAGLGDLSVFLFFGLLGVLGTYFLHTLSFEPHSVYIGISLGLFSTAVLNINNIRDIESDLKAGKRSIPVRIGREKAVSYHWGLILAGNIQLAFFAISTEKWLTLVSIPAFLLMAKIAAGVQKAKSSAETDPFLKKMALTTLLWVILFGLGLLIS
jgi:1,4-dihydroxy-2-naphthoate octaprenyltransferase